MRAPAKITRDAELVLRWSNLFLSTYCVTVEVDLWITSPRSSVYEFLAFHLSLLAIVCWPFLLISSILLLQVSYVRVAVGLVALAVSVYAMRQVEWVFCY